MCQRMNLKAFVFSNDLWLLDSIVCVAFAFCFGYWINLLSDNSEYYEKLTLAYGIAAYTGTLGLMALLKRQMVWLPRWAWLAMLGALVRIMVLQIISVPNSLAYYLRFSASYWLAVVHFSSDFIVGTVFNWLLWAIAGLVFSSIARALAWAIYVAWPGRQGQ